MTKNDIINSVVWEMSDVLTKEQQDRLKITFLVKMQNYEITEMTTLPSVVTHDNEWLYKRYIIDQTATGLKETSIKNYVSAVRKLFEETGKNYNEIKGQDITDYLAVKQFRDKISINYKSTLYRYFSTFFNWAYRKHHIANDIMCDVDRVKAVQKKKERLTDEEIEDMREVCQTPKEKALFELMLSTGMRVGEIANLNVSDIDFLRKRVEIFGEKTNRYRTGMLTTKAVKALKAYLDSKPHATAAVFTGDRKPYNRLLNGTLEKIAKEIGKKAGITRMDTTVHVYRKTFASVQYHKTKDVLMVSKLMGHAKTDMTVQYYLIDDIDDMQYRYNVVNG